MKLINKLSIVVSVYNEEAVLDKFYETILPILEGIDSDYELIFVNDGSRDASPAILDRLAMDSKKVKVIHFSRNYGHEAAMIAGIDYSSGDGIVCMDADLQHPVECIPQILDTFNQGYEVISMVRTANKSAGFVKNLTSGLFYKILNKISEVHFEENASDFFAITKKPAEVLKKHFRETSRFLRAYVQSIGFKKTTIEYEAHDRAAGESKYSIKGLFKFSVQAMLSYSQPAVEDCFIVWHVCRNCLCTVDYLLYLYEDSCWRTRRLYDNSCSNLFYVYSIILLVGDYWRISGSYFIRNKKETNLLSKGCGKL